MSRIFVLFVFASSLGFAPNLAAAAVQLGVLGDSLSDEYAEQSYGLYAENWVQQLEIHAGIDVGPTATEAAQPGGTWGEPRRTQYEYNWARAGATSGSLLSNGQHTGLAAQVAPNGIDYAVMMIGANDQFDGLNAYANIYAGAWTQPSIDAWVGGITANINTALDTVLPTGVNLVLVNAPDYGVTPAVQGSFPSASGRQAVADVLDGDLNSAIEAIAQTRQVPYIDLFGAAEAMFGAHASLNTTLSIGNVDIFLMQVDTNVGGNPDAGFVHDGIHPNTTLQGVLANLMLEGMNIGYGAMISQFTEAEILSHRGIAYGGSDTLLAQIGAYSDFVTDYAPIFLMGDISKNGTVGPEDYTLWANAFGQSGSGLLADLSGNGMVGPEDYTLWANNFGMMVGGDSPESEHSASASLDGSGTVGAEDYTLWANNFGMSSGGVTPAVPEPSSMVLACIGLIGLLACGRRRWR